MERSRLDSFWDKKAKRYPLPFEEKTYQGTLGVLERIKKRGVSFRGKAVLEVGCGTGVFTLPIAQEASFVLGIDCSEEMIKLLTREAEKREIRNVSLHLAFWDGVNIDLMGLRKRFDIGLAAMTAAIKTKEDLLKLEDSSRDWVVYIGWGRKRENSLMEEVFRLHGMELKPPAGSSMVQRCLKELGREPYTEAFESFWDWEGTVEEALEDLSGFIEMEGGVPQEETIRGVLNDQAEHGKIRHRTHVEQTLIVWGLK